ncbi:sigma factor-like helix-turn-helix DNA-binding protein [Amycolatopsis sp. NBC_01480]|uniref:sigma factor-like helix-turn-helix DNA-binding protein n=1 Tax=Amycolatopsis sp. NBC_01480 TaxID=2903562 RepID=UPI002E29810F|nr:sigma factor-like helix-turn-helix DNA-binding protein [Amycolatopsis sp. NBC_01480]
MGSSPQASPNRAVIAEQTARAYEMRLKGVSYRRIADELGVSLGTAHNRVREAMAERVDPLVDEYRQFQLDRLDSYREAAVKVLETTHWRVDHGRVVALEDEATGTKEPLADDGPVLAAIDRLLRIEERTARLLGLDAPAKAEVSATVETIRPEVLDLVEQAEAAVSAEEARLRDTAAGQGD